MFKLFNDIFDRVQIKLKNDKFDNTLEEGNRKTANIFIYNIFYFCSFLLFHF